MKTLTLITGLPYSGKTTKAKELIDKDKHTIVRISQKDYKEMIYDQIQKNFSQFYTDFLIEKYLFSIDNVVVDSDCLLPKEVDHYKTIAKRLKIKFKHLRLKTSMEKCIERAQNDNAKHRIPDIVNTALRYNLYTDISRPFHIVDVTHKDMLTPRTIKAMVKAAQDKKDIILISILPESKRFETEAQLREKNLFSMGLPINTLIMAEEHNRMSPKETKKWIIDTYNLKKFTK